MLPSRLLGTSSIASAVAFTLFTTSAAPSFAFELARTAGGAELVWPSPSIPYAVVFELGDDSGEQLASATRAAFDTWSSASAAAIVPLYLGPFPGAAPDDRKPTVALQSPWDTNFGPRDRTVAHAELFYDVATGHVRDGDIFLNGEAFAFGEAAPGVFDTESVVLHELGHVLGFGHSCGEPRGAHPSCFSVPDDPPGHRLAILEAVMAPTLSFGTSRRALGPDDRAGLAAHYAGTATAAQLETVTRKCPQGWLQLSSGAPADPEIGFRYASGLFERLSWDRAGDVYTLSSTGPRAGFGGADLVVRDPMSGALSAQVDFTAPPPCIDEGFPPIPVPKPTPSGGCTCMGVSGVGAHRQGGGNAATIFFVGLLACAVLPMRRRRSSMTLLRRAAAAAAVVVAGGLMFPGDAAAFKCSRVGADFGPSLVWASRMIPWWADTRLFEAVGDVPTVEAEVRAAFAAWEEPPCSDLAFPYQGSERGLRGGFVDGTNNRNVVSYVASGWPYESAAIAVTTSAYDTRSGVVVDADIEFNGQEFRFVIADPSCDARAGTMDLRNTLTHEVGHIVGLDHPPNTPSNNEVTMFASAPPCETKKQTLAQDDIDGLCAVYPTGATTQQCFSPDGPKFRLVESDDGFGGCTHTSGGQTGSAGVLSLLALLWLGRRQRPSNKPT